MAEAQDPVWQIHIIICLSTTKDNLPPNPIRSATVMELRNYITAKISLGEQQGYVAECLEINAVTQGRNLDKIVSNLQEAVALYLEDEDPTEFGLIAKPTLLVTFDLQQKYAEN